MELSDKGIANSHVHQHALQSGSVFITTDILEEEGERIKTRLGRIANQSAI